MRLSLLSVCLSLCPYHIVAQWTHTSVLRTVDLSQSYVKELLVVILENTSNETQFSYTLPAEYAESIDTLAVRPKDKSLGDPLQLRLETTICKVILAEPVPAKGKITLSITRALLHKLRPLPTKMDQNGQQFLAYDSTKLIQLSYPIQKQKTKFKLPNSNVPDYTEGGSLQGNVLSYALHDASVDTNVAEETIHVRFENTAPLPIVTYIERDIEVSHFGGNVAFEDRFAITNEAAQLKDPFDRIAFAQAGFYNPKSSAIRDINFVLPEGTRSPYYTDEIGNVSTSRFRKSKRNAQLELKPRYPIFGGWNYTFVVGYNNKLGKFLKHKGSRYMLTVPFLEGAVDMTYDDIRLRVILPEGAKNVDVQTPLNRATVSFGILKTFMDTIGRTVVVIQAADLTDEMAKRPLVVSYDYTSIDLIRKPSVVMAAVAAILTASVVLGKLF